MNDKPIDASAVQITRLRKVYHSAGRAGVVAVDGVDLMVREGELLVLLGPSGCGKTTLLRSVAGLEVPDEGEVTIGGRRVFSSPERLNLPPEQRRIGMMFQSYALWPHMTVYQNVAYPLSSEERVSRGEVQARVQELLSKLGVAGFDHRYPSELSGGQQQRVALARALVASPSVILFDEPLSNVDARVRRRLRSQLRELKHQTRFAGIYVTHDQEEAMELADTLAVMENGKIQQIASSREVYTRPASLYVAGFVGEINRWAGRIESVNGETAVVSTALGTFNINGATAQAGARGWLVIRPERVRIFSSESRPANASVLCGTVKEATYFGSRCEIRVEVAQESVMAWMFDADSSRIYPSPGDEVGVLPEPGSLQWLTD